MSITDCLSTQPYASLRALSITKAAKLNHLKQQVGGGGQMAADLMNQTITNIVV